MAEIYCGVVSESEVSSAFKPSSRQARRRRMELRRCKVAPAETSDCDINGDKRQKFGDCSSEAVVLEGKGNGKFEELTVADHTPEVRNPKFGVTSVCGRRRDMEDAVAIHPWFHKRGEADADELHYFGVYDGHGCSHVAMNCKDRLHQLLKEEMDKNKTSNDWKNAMEQSFNRMDKEATSRHEMVAGTGICRCQLRTPDCDAVGSTAVVSVLTPDKIVVANCGDSRAVLCRNGKAVPLSTDHKPDRPDELKRIEAAGGRVIYWEGPRVLGVLAMSRAIGDGYLKPYVTSEPEITVTDRTAEDDCLILASDGLWDVVSNETACEVAKMCLTGKVPAGTPSRVGRKKNVDKACWEASMLLAKLALARRSTDNVSVVVVDLRRAT